MQKFTAVEYLKIDIANNFGLDQLDWDDRIEWYDNNEHQMDALVAKAKEPALFYAGLMAMYNAQQGNPIGYPVSLDATSSGLQILAVLTGDRLAAEICNVIDTNQRKDAYTAIYQRMVSKLGEGSVIHRDDTKQAIMTALFGSKAVPKEVFGEGMLLKVFYDTMMESAPAAWEMNKGFLALWDENAVSNDWVLPDNFHVQIKVIDTIKEVVHFRNKPYDTYYKVNQPIAEGRSLGANTVHSIDGMVVRELTRRCDYRPYVVKRVARLVFNSWEPVPESYPDTKDNFMVMTLWEHYQNTGYLSARILDHLNKENFSMVSRCDIQELIDSLPVKPFKVIAVHDCFRCLPNYANDLREQYNRQLMLIGKSTLLQSVVSQILGRTVTIGKLDPDLWKEMMVSNYALS